MAVFRNVPSSSPKSTKMTISLQFYRFIDLYKSMFHVSGVCLSSSASFDNPIFFTFPVFSLVKYGRSSPRNVFFLTSKSVPSIMSPTSNRTSNMDSLQFHSWSSMLPVSSLIVYFCKGGSGSPFFFRFSFIFSAIFLPRTFTPFIPSEMSAIFVKEILGVWGWSSAIVVPSLHVLYPVFGHPKHAFPVRKRGRIDELGNPPVLLAPAQVQPVSGLVREHVPPDRDRRVAEQYARPIHHLVGQVYRQVVGVCEFLQGVQMLV